ncbi:TetR/AcrR family transcriptional regulator [Knoellia koreensis]|uniref:TetR/AcrR family transcriptional regulator n=1 Tax=Knoellia koreensis TaxID=2730921 RepID=A0A849HLA6_9MICO|nr:TetR/AcrR family transcriptional regulator [Knoellia sp. DB2414S]NNM48112.1 TetR/AcrR family transcriptional regulator [Knoellia sp. DB2414S]
MTATATRSTYHHGDLRAALVAAANEMLEQGEPLSLRALARRAGVSPTALYRHFADKEALESALAVRGLRDLFTDLTAGKAAPSTPKDVTELGVRYVRFALRRPELFKLMFGRECDDQDDERVRAAAALHDYLAAVMADVFPGSPADDLATAGWGLAHGLAFLHLDGKLPKDKPRAVDRRVRAAYAAILPTTN